MNFEKEKLPGRVFARNTWTLFVKKIKLSRFSSWPKTTKMKATLLLQMQKQSFKKFKISLYISQVRNVWVYANLVLTSIESCLINGMYIRMERQSVINHKEVPSRTWGLHEELYSSLKLFATFRISHAGSYACVLNFHSPSAT